LFPPLVRTARRVAEIVRDQPEETLDPDLLRDERERALYEGLQAARRQEVHLEGDDARGRWLAVMSRLAAESERFIDEVLVHDESAAASSGLALLQAVDRVFSREICLGSLRAGGARIV
jgi:glycyl-tRNA synthetase beta subunit